MPRAEGYRAVFVASVEWGFLLFELPRSICRRRGRSSDAKTRSLDRLNGEGDKANFKMSGFDCASDLRAMCRLNFDTSFEVQDRFSGNEYAVFLQLAKEIAGPLGKLSSGESRFLETFGPVRSHYAVSGSGNGILVYSIFGSEETAYEIDRSSRCGDDDAAKVQIAQAVEIWSERDDFRFVVEDNHVVLRSEARARLFAQGIDERLWCFAGYALLLREVESQSLVVFRDLQVTAEGIESDERIGVTQMKNNVRGSEGGVSAKGDFAFWSEPTDTVAVIFFDEIDGFRKVVFRGNRL